MSGRGPLAVAVFASGGGTNFQALLDHQSETPLWQIALLIMNRQGGAAERAAAAGVPARVIPTRDRSDAEVAEETLAILEEYGIDVVLLAGYLRRVPDPVTAAYEGRILNIHPAVLPDFGGPGMYGMNVHRAVIASDVIESGATVHFVTPTYDDGVILGQWRVERLPGDTPDDLAARVLSVEHALYPRAVDHLCRALVEGVRPARMPDVWLDEPPATTRTTQPTGTNEDQV